MALNKEQQIMEAINRSHHILVVFRADSGDDLAAGLALKNILNKLNKDVEIISPEAAPSHLFEFLPNFKDIRSELSPLQKFIIKIDLTKNKLASLSYDVKQDNLFIYITPKTGAITHENIKTAATNLKFDLIITVGCSDLPSLGSLYHNNTSLFAKVPLINFDHEPANENFGSLNWIDISALANTEIIFELLQKTWPDLIDLEIATLLLTGLIVKTQSFRTANINSRTLQNASQLVNLGADREKIIQHLYRRRTLPTLKLWGKALANLKNDSKNSLVWTALTKNDFIDTGASSLELSGIIDELISNAPEAKIISIFYETEVGIEIIIANQLNFDLKSALKEFNPEGIKNKIKIKLDKINLLEAEQKIIEIIKNSLDKR
ncbi:MAG TPA: hypothetical protein PKY08_01110 [Candidatus Magasanikbacteria bacterium]|nr:hypothetical protein [Candidatus Magasanikbacteria bacterium]